MTSKQKREFTSEFKREAVGLLASGGRTTREIAGDLDLGLSTLNRRKRELRDAQPVTTPNPDTTKELAHLRKENKILRQELDLLKKSDRLLRQGNMSMRYKLIDNNKAAMPMKRMCRMMAVSVSGYYAWKDSKPSLHQCYDVVLATNIRT